MTALRRKAYKERVPTINLKIGYLNKNNNEITIVEAEKTQISRFDPRIYQKLFEIATVEVIHFISYITSYL